MQEKGRAFWFAIAAITPAAAVATLLMFQLKKVEIINTDTEAELLLGRQSRQRQLDLALEVEAPQPAAEAAP